jgi:hypothetical protein
MQRVILAALLSAPIAACLIGLSHHVAEWYAMTAEWAGEHNDFAWLIFVSLCVFAGLLWLTKRG